MPPLVRTEDLLDAQGVADFLGLAHRNSVSTYQARYPDMPRPVVIHAGGRIRLWHRPDMERWARARGRLRR